MRLAPAAMAVALVAALASPVSARDLEEELADVRAQSAAVSAQIDAARADRTAIAVDLLATEARLDELVVDLNRTRAKLAGLRDQLVAQETTLGDVRNELGNLYLDLAATRQRLDAERLLAQDWARQLYMTAGQDDAYLALAATDLNDISLGMEYLDRVSEETNRVIHEFEALRQREERQAELAEVREAEVAAAVAVLQSIEVDLADTEAQQAERQAEVAAEVERQRNLLATIEHDLSHFEGELDALASEQAQIEQAIKAAATGGGVAPGSMVRPVPGAITSAFGPRTHPILGYVRMHTGVDFRAPYGQSIRAAASGTVVLAGSYGGYGNTVVISHGGGVSTLYAHQSSLAVRRGDTVTAGDTVGYVGSTGLSTGPHLHFEVRENGSPVNPMRYL